MYIYIYVCFPEESTTHVSCLTGCFGAELFQGLMECSVKCLGLNQPLFYLEELLRRVQQWMNFWMSKCQSDNNSIARGICHGWYQIDGGENQKTALAIHWLRPWCMKQGHVQMPDLQASVSSQPPILGAKVRSIYRTLLFLRPSVNHGRVWWDTYLTSQWHYLYL